MQESVEIIQEELSYNETTIHKRPSKQMDSSIQDFKLMNELGASSSFDSQSMRRHLSSNNVTLP